jgi:hypothetical protein
MKILFLLIAIFYTNVPANSMSLIEKTSRFFSTAHPLYKEYVPLRKIYPGSNALNTKYINDCLKHRSNHFGAFEKEEQLNKFGYSYKDKNTYFCYEKSGKVSSFNEPFEAIQYRDEHYLKPGKEYPIFITLLHLHNLCNDLEKIVLPLKINYDFSNCFGGLSREEFFAVAITKKHVTHPTDLIVSGKSFKPRSLPMILETLKNNRALVLKN